ncbi:MAG: reverse transcriptase/maturase family protein [Patescibacteria group bacterium]|nr:reverse transcriptase/maturase family protein [Patescibacteria group bacterium]
MFSHSDLDCSTETLFGRAISIESLFFAWHKFIKGKRQREDIIFWERYLEENIFSLHEELSNNRYRHSRYSFFNIYDPKKRNIDKAIVKDRIVHQTLFSVIEPIFERRFIYDSYSCRIGKGTHAASRRLQFFLGKASKNNTKTVYALKLDIEKFFNGLDHKILIEFLRRDITDKRIMRLLTHVIKSFQRVSGKGLPLGNLTSQLFANIYLHELDFFVKQHLKEKWYLRYCDDFIIVHDSREHLLNLIGPIQDFLKKRLKLDIHPTKISIRTWNQGIDFVGYVHMSYCMVLRAKTKKRMLTRIEDKNFFSYMGLCKHADSFELQQDILNKIAQR